MSGVYGGLWERLKKDKKIKIRIPVADLEDMSPLDVRKKLRQIRKHVSDCKARDFEFRNANRYAVLHGAQYSYAEGWIVLELKDFRSRDTVRGFNVEKVDS